MHDMTAASSLIPSQRREKYQALHKQFPTSAYLRRRAPRNVP